MRENVYYLMGIAGIILTGVCVFMLIIDTCCYEVMSGVTIYLFIIMIVVAVLLVRIGFGKLKD